MMRYAYVMKEGGEIKTTRSQRIVLRAVRAGANAYGPKDRRGPFVCDYITTATRGFVVFDRIAWRLAGVVQRPCGVSGAGMG